MVIFSIFMKINVGCVYSLESSHCYDSFKYTQHTFQDKRSVIIPYIVISKVMGKNLRTHERVRNSRDK